MYVVGSLVIYFCCVLLNYVIGYIVSLIFFFFKQKTAYEWRIGDWSSDVCSSDLQERAVPDVRRGLQVVEPGQRLGGGLPAVRADGGGDQRAVVVRAAQGGGMNRPFATAVVNGLLVALAVLSLAPLLWMLSVSFMQTGQAAPFPPPYRKSGG